MALYDRHLNKLDIDTNNVQRINESKVTNAFIYKYKDKYEDIAIKKYWYYTDFAIGTAIFDKLCCINNKYFIELKDLFTIISDEEYKERYSKFLQGKRFFIKDGYTSKFYQKEEIDNPILVNNTYLIRNIEGLCELVDILSNLKILMKDTKLENAIIQKEGIVIIDPDYYKFSDANIENIKEHNYGELLNLIQDIFIHFAFFKKTEIVEYFERLKIADSIETIYQLEKSLRKVRKPIDLII